MKNYTEIRPSLETGDIVFFERKKKIGWGWLIEKTTGSRMVHCGVIVRDDNRVWLFEANEKYGVRNIFLSKVKQDFCVYHLHAHHHIALTRAFKNEVFAMAGENYEISGALRAGFGKGSRKAEAWYCSELAVHILKKIRDDLNLSWVLTPGDLAAALEHANIKSVWVQKPPQNQKQGSTIRPYK